MPDERFGPYRELVRLAVGGTAEVFRALDSRTGELVALKILLPQASGDVRDRVLAEARVQERVRHPSLVAVREHGAIDARAYLALELVDGPSLATVLGARRLSPATAVHIALQLLDALGAVHAARDADGRALDIVHRDVTPQNIMFDGGGNVKLGDFGIARSRGGAQTRTGMIKGKLGYLAPEQVTQSTVDARTDLYQLGLVLFEMLCGVPYFDGMSELELLRAAEAPVAKLPSALGAPALLDAVVQRALQRFPEERYASADAFARALAALAPALGEPDLAFAATGNRAAVAAARVGPALTRGRLWLAVAAAVSLACGALFVGYRGAARSSRATAPSGEATAVPEVAVASPAVVIPAPSQPAAVVTPRKVRATRVAAPPAAAQDALVDRVAEPPPPLDVLTPCIERMQQRGIAVVDLASALQDELGSARRASGDAAAQNAVCAKLDALAIDRPMVERKLARMQRRIDALATDDPRRPALSQLTRDTLQTLLDGNVGRTDAKLRELDALLTH